jgi:hypothetical protein
MSGPPSKHALPPRSAALSRFMAAPLIVATVLMTATVTLAALAWFGGTADGDRVTIRLSGACAAESLPHIKERATSVGLGDPEFTQEPGVIIITATLPGLEDDATAVPRLLGQRGWLEVRQGETVVLDSDAVIEANIRLDEGGAAYTWLDIKKEAVAPFQAVLDADIQGELTFHVDDELAAVRPNTRGVKDDGLRVVAHGDMKPAVRMKIAADTSIVLTHGPLACALNASAPVPVASPGSPE